MDKHEVEGGAKEAKGNLKEAAGRVLGDRDLEAEGTVDKTAGKTEKNFGKIKDAVKDQLR